MLSLQHVDNADAKKELALSTELLDKSLKGLGNHLKKTKQATTSIQIEAARELIDSLSTELDDLNTALDAFELKPKPGDSRQNAVVNLKMSAENIKSNVGKLSSYASTNRQDLLNNAGINLAYGLEDFMNAVQELASTSNDPSEAKQIIEASKLILKDSSNILEMANTNVDGSKKENDIHQFVENIEKGLADMVQNLQESSDENLESIDANITEFVETVNKLMNNPSLQNYEASNLSSKTSNLIDELEKELSKTSNSSTKNILNSTA